MGAVKNAFMEEIEKDFEYRSLVNPRMNLEPEPLIDSELKGARLRAEDIIDYLRTIREPDTCILERIDLLEYAKHCSDTLQKSLSIALKEQWEIQEEREREAEEEARRDYEAMEEVYAEVRASFI